MSFAYRPGAWIIIRMRFFIKQSTGHDPSHAITMCTRHGRAIPNLRPAACAACGRKIAELSGWAIRGPGDWPAYCTEFLLASDTARQVEKCTSNI